MEFTNSSFASDLGKVVIDKLLHDGYTLNKWISVEDALPELNTNVLAYAVGKKGCFEDQIAITRLTDTIWFGHEIKTDPYWKDPWQYFHSDYEITHWIPLPAPPSKKEKRSHGISCAHNRIENPYIDCASIIHIVDAADEIVDALYKQGANKDYKCKHLREKLNEIRKELTGDGGTC